MCHREGIAKAMRKANSLAHTELVVQHRVQAMRRDNDRAGCAPACCDHKEWRVARTFLTRASSNMGRSTFSNTAFVSTFLFGHTLFTPLRRQDGRVHVSSFRTTRRNVVG